MFLLKFLLFERWPDFDVWKWSCRNQSSWKSKNLSCYRVQAPAPPKAHDPLDPWKTALEPRKRRLSNVKNRVRSIELL